MNGRINKIIYRKSNPFIFDKHIYSRSFSDFFKTVQFNQSDCLIRSNLFGKEIVWGDTKFFFPSRPGKQNLHSMYIFGMVKKDANKFIASKKNILKLTKWKPSVWWNENLKDDTTRKIVGVDVDGAYWKIAMSMGIISESTYNHGKAMKQKNIRLAALASLGSDKEFAIFRKAKMTNDVMIIKGDDTLKLIYKSIRYRCYKYMQELAVKLGDDFVCYKTDCIYFYQSAMNSKIVKDFLDKKGLDYKMLHVIPDEVEEKYSI